VRITPEERLDRLVHLHELGERLSQGDPTRPVNMGVWMSDRECGTVACLAGWATTEPWFRERGLAQSKVNPASPITIPSHQQLIGIRGLASFFGLTAKRAQSIFFAPSLSDAMLNLHATIKYYRNKAKTKET